MQAPVLLGNIFEDAGHILADSARGIIDLGKRARGDSADMLVNQEVGSSLETKIVYGSLLALGLYLVVKK